MKAVLGRSPGLNVFGNDWPTRDGTGVRDYIHVEDLATAHVAALDHLSSGSGESVTLNVGTGQGTSVLEIIAATERITGRPVPHRIVDRRAGDVSEVWADGSRMRALTGWEPVRTLDDIISTAFAWHSANPDGHPA
jgi:UDP-glucose 4-epimerase